MKFTNEIKVILIVLGVFVLSHFLHWYFLSRATIQANKTIAQLQHDNDTLTGILVSAASRDSTARQAGTTLVP